MMTEQSRFQSFAEFYPFYLREHSHPVCRGLHYAGSSLGVVIAVIAIVSAQYLLIIAALVVGYACAWVGHFFFEHNRPATFKYPVWSFMGDWVMLTHFLTGRLRHVHPVLAAGTSEDSCSRD